jgi:NAD(P)-dependent dehydrogenase (short-subunit alcohol dehydrogenase family)
MQGEASNPNGGTRGAVLVTGASSGIGRAVAFRLAGEGFRVFAGIRDEQTAGELSGAAGGRILPVRMDVTDEGSVQAAADVVGAELSGAPLKGLVNNAGEVVIGPVELLRPEDVRRQFDTNVTGQIVVTQRFLPLLRSSHGRIVNMGSLTGELSFPFSGPYSGSKAALAALTDALRVEVAPWGIEVCLIEAGNIRTGIWEKHVADVRRLIMRVPEERLSLYRRRLEADLEMVEHLQHGGVSPRVVEDAILHALTAERPKTRYLVGLDAKTLSRLVRFIPDRLRDALITRYMRLPRQ